MHRAQECTRTYQRTLFGTPLPPAGPQRRPIRREGEDGGETDDHRFRNRLSREASPPRREGIPFRHARMMLLRSVSTTIRQNCRIAQTLRAPQRIRGAAGVVSSCNCLLSRPARGWRRPAAAQTGRQRNSGTAAPGSRLSQERETPTNGGRSPSHSWKRLAIGQAPVAAEGTRRDLDAGGAWRRLYSLRSTMRDDAPDHRLVEAHGDDLVDAAVLLDVGLEDRVEHLGRAAASPGRSGRAAARPRAAAR